MTKSSNISTTGLWKQTFLRFQRHKMGMFALWLIAIMAIIAFLADFLSNEKPIFCSIENEFHAPVFKEYGVSLGITGWPEHLRNVEWKDLEYDWSIWPLIPYLPRNIDFKNSNFVGPFDKQEIKSLYYRHWLGTDGLGRDVLAGLIHGTRIALTIGLVAMGIAMFIGVFIGAVAGFMGDHQLRMSRAALLTFVLTLLLGLFYAFGVRAYTLEDAIGESFFSFFVALMISFLILAGFLYSSPYIARPLKRIKLFRKVVKVPLDMILSRVIEVMDTIPALFLIISLVAISRPSIFLVMIVIGLVSWTGIARFIRAELLRIRSLNYIEAGRSLGLPVKRILFRHALPNALPPALVSIAFGMASAILIEAVLSFLGIAVPLEQITWGNMLAGSRNAPGAWWLAVFPGMAIFMTVTCFNLIGEGLTQALNPKLNQDSKT